MHCFGGDGVGSYYVYEGGDGWDGSFGYQFTNGRLRIWLLGTSDVQDAANTCDVRFDEGSMTLSECSEEGVHELQCKDVRIGEVGDVYCTPAAR